MKTITVITIFLACIIYNSSAQIQVESMDGIIPKSHLTSNLPYFNSGPLMIVVLDSNEYMLDSITTSQINVDWIQSLSVYKHGVYTKKYGSRGDDGIVIIKPKLTHIDDFSKVLQVSPIIKVE